MLGWSTGIACFAPGVVLKSSVEVVAIAGQLIAKTKSSDNRPEDFNTARSGRERYPNQPRKKTSGSANLPKWKDVLSGRGRELQSVLLRDWYIGCAQPSQGCERGSTPLSRSSNPFCKHFRQSFNWQKHWQIRDDFQTLPSPNRPFLTLGSEMSLFAPCHYLRPAPKSFREVVGRPRSVAYFAAQQTEKHLDSRRVLV